MDTNKTEKYVKAQIKKRLIKHGIYRFMPIPLHNRGVPDFIICLNGYFVAIECKSASGKISPHQQEHAERIDYNNGIVLLVNPDNLSDCLKWLDECGQDAWPRASLPTSCIFPNLD